MSEQRPQIKRYGFLLLISLFYKVIALIVFIVTVVLVLQTLTQVAGSNLQNMTMGEIWTLILTSTFAPLLGGIVLAISFYALARLIDVMLSINDSVRILANQVERIGKMDRAENDFGEFLRTGK